MVYQRWVVYRRLALILGAQPQQENDLYAQTARDMLDQIEAKTAF
jgi:hypothetical protein